MKCPKCKSGIWDESDFIVDEDTDIALCPECYYLDFDYHADCRTKADKRFEANVPEGFYYD